MYCKVFEEIYGIQTVALRYSNVFSPKKDPNSWYSAIIPKFICAIRNGESPKYMMIEPKVETLPL